MRQTDSSIRCFRRDENRATTFWLAPKLDYLPVEMRQTEPGKATISLVLTEIRFDDRNSM